MAEYKDYADNTGEFNLALKKMAQEKIVDVLNELNTKTGVLHILGSITTTDPTDPTKHLPLVEDVQLEASYGLAEVNHRPMSAAEIADDVSQMDGMPITKEYRNNVESWINELVFDAMDNARKENNEREKAISKFARDMTIKYLGPASCDVHENAKQRSLYQDIYNLLTIKNQ